MTRANPPVERSVAGTSACSANSSPNATKIVAGTEDDRVA
jgi:hypothetical protein